MDISGLASFTYTNSAAGQFVGNVLNANGISGGNIRVVSEDWLPNPRRVTITLTPASWQTLADVERVIQQALESGAAAYPDLMWDVGEFRATNTVGLSTGSVGGQIGGGFNPGAVTNTGGGSNSTPSATGSRTVIVRVTGSFGVVGMFTTDEPTAIRTRLQENGWSISSVTQDSTAVYPGQAVTYLVTANVLNQYNDQAVIQNIISQLSGLMTGVSATIVRGGSAAGGGSDFLSSLGLGAGISTPIALLGAAIVLIVIMKR